MNVDDLLILLQNHWIDDVTTFADERQRIQLALLLLTAAVTASRSCSLINTSKGKIEVEEKRVEDDSWDE